MSSRDYNRNSQHQQQSGGYNDEPRNSQNRNAQQSAYDPQGQRGRGQFGDDSNRYSNNGGYGGAQQGGRQDWDRDRSQGFGGGRSYGGQDHGYVGSNAGGYDTGRQRGFDRSDWNEPSRARNNDYGFDSDRAYDRVGRPDDMYDQYNDRYASDRFNRASGNRNDYDRSAQFSQNAGYGSYGNDYDRGGYGNARALGNQSGGLGGQSHHDADYHNWRQEQVRNLDRDYDDWRQERFQKFSNEFNTWRTGRTRNENQNDHNTPSQSGTTTGSSNKASSSSGSK